MPRTEDEDRQIAAKAKTFMTFRVMKIVKQVDVMEFTLDERSLDRQGVPPGGFTTAKMPGQSRIVVHAISEEDRAFTFDIDPTTYEKVFKELMEKARAARS